MKALHWIILGGLGLAIILILIALLSRPQLSNISCSVRLSFCSRERRKFWHALQEAVGRDYLVLANIPLATLVVAAHEGGEHLQEWLQQRWADFAILQEQSFRPTAIVQFEREDEDSSLWQPGRDDTLAKVMEQAGLTLLWLPSDNYQHVDLLRHALEQAKGQGTKMVEDGKGNG